MNTHLEKTQPLISVILPTHNRADMLPRAVESVLGQSFANIELIIVADCCTDNSKDVVSSFNDDRIQFVELFENVGGAQARNIGVERAKGEYIAFLDDDDEWYSTKLSEQLEVFQNNADIAIVSCNYHIVKDEKIIGTSNLKNKININEMLYENSCGSFSFCMTRKEYVNECRIDTRLKACQDWDLWLKILLSNKGKNCKVVSKPLVMYHAGHIDKLTNNFNSAFHSFIMFLRNYWPHMSINQRNYNLYVANKKKRITTFNNIGYWYNMRLYLKALFHYHRASYNYSLFAYLLFIPQIFRLNRNLSQDKFY